MARMYTAQFGGVASAAVQDFFELISTATQVIVVHSIFIGQSSDSGDAAAEMLRVQLKRASGSYTSGTGGTTATGVPHAFSDPAFGGTVEANNSTQAAVGTGALTTLMEETFNIQAGWYYTPTPEERITLSPSQALIVSGPTVPADSLTFSGRITFEVHGTA